MLLRPADELSRLLPEMPKKNATLERLVLIVFLPLQGILAVHFLHGRWVA